MGIELPDIKRGFDNYTLAPGRGAVLTGIHNSRLIDGTYNGGVGSVFEGVKFFDQAQSGQEKEPIKIVLLGDMRELGLQEEAHHQELAEILTTCTSITHVVLVGAVMHAVVLHRLASKYGIRAK
jgi:UDP-N-acetylmuramyl pentapeptide synthase